MDPTMSRNRLSVPGWKNRGPATSRRDLRCLAAALLAACLGFLLGSLRDVRTHRPDPLTDLMLDPRLQWRSFSEVQLARAALRMYAEEYLREAQQRIAQTLRQEPSRTTPETGPRQHSLQPVIHLLEDALDEFRGTGLESEILRPLLFALKHEGRYDHWLDLYLDTLRRRPTDPIVTDFLHDAQTLARKTGRESEWIAALTLPPNLSPLLSSALTFEDATPALCARTTPNHTPDREPRP